MDKHLQEKKPAVVTPALSPMARYAEDFQKVFTEMVAADKSGHTGDIVPRAQPYEP